MNYCIKVRASVMSSWLPPLARIRETKEALFLDLPLVLASSVPF